MTEDGDTIRLSAVNARGYVLAKPGQCIYLTHVADRWALAVPEGMAGTITARPGELGIYLGQRGVRE